MLTEDQTNHIKCKEDYDNLIDMRKVVFKKAEVNGNIVFEVDRKKDGWDMMKGVGLWKKMLFSNFRVSRSARLDRYEYVYFLKTNEDQVILERQPCTTRLANSNKTFFVKTTIGFQFVDLRRVRRNENDKKNQDDQKKNVSVFNRFSPNVRRPSNNGFIRRRYNNYGYGYRNRYRGNGYNNYFKRNDNSNNRRYFKGFNDIKFRNRLNRNSVSFRNNKDNIPMDNNRSINKGEGLEDKIFKRLCERMERHFKGKNPNFQ